MLSCFLQSSLDVSVQLDGRNQTHLAMYDEEQFKRSTLDGSGVARFHTCYVFIRDLPSHY
jgi:hypothetical protein